MGPCCLCCFYAVGTCSVTPPSYKGKWRQWGLHSFFFSTFFYFVCSFSSFFQGLDWDWGVGPSGSWICKCVCASTPMHGLVFFVPPVPCPVLGCPTCPQVLLKNAAEQHVLKLVPLAVAKWNVALLQQTYTTDTHPSSRGKQDNRAC